MNDAEDAVAVLHRGRDNPQRDEVVDLLEVALATLQFLVNRPETFDASVDRHHRDLRVGKLLGERDPQFLHQHFRRLAPGLHFGAQLLIGLRFEVTEGQFLELVLDLAHAEPVGNRRVDIAGFLGDSHPAVLGQVVQRPHVVQAVGQLHHDDPHIVDHGQEHLAETLGLALLTRGKLQAGEFGHALDDVGDLLTEQFPDFLDGIGRVFDDVVQEAGGDGHDVQTLVGQQIGDFQGMHQIRLPRSTDLSLVLVGRKYIGPPEQFGVRIRIGGPDFVDKIFEPNHFPGV